jgi:hypothetical protein
MTRALLVIVVAACRWGPTQTLSPRIPSQITAPCTVTGVVMNMRKNYPIAGTTVFFGDSKRSWAIADENGKFNLERHPDDVTFTVAVFKRYLVYPASEITCTEPITITIDVHVDDDGNDVPIEGDES